jgi:seryl-tRNA synthetase
MLDIKFIREHPNEVKEGCRKKGVDFDLDRLLEVDEKRRRVLKEVEDLRAQQKKTSTEAFHRRKEGETLDQILGLDDPEPSPSRGSRGEG